MSSAPHAHPDRVVRIDASRAADTKGGFGPESRTSSPVGRAVVIGNFDGVHRGHQAVLHEASSLAKSRGLETLVLTFDPHPATVLFRVEPATLTTIPRRAALLLEVVDRVAVRTFDGEFSQTPPEAFAKGLLYETLGAKVVVVGDDFRFGHKRAGDLARLRELGAELGFEVAAHALAGDASGRFSSSRVREAIGRGEVDVAADVLGRPHSLAGTVVAGDGRGRTIGVPTANLAGAKELLPSRGVFAVRVDLVTSADDALLETLEPLAGGVMNHGIKPTVGAGLAPTLEAHLFDFERDLYGKKLRVHLIAKLRDEQKFSGLEALTTQISKDMALARDILQTAPAT